jgi:hypothetical protein
MPDHCLDKAQQIDPNAKQQNANHHFRVGLLSWLGLEAIIVIVIWAVITAI